MARTLRSVKATAKREGWLKWIRSTADERAALAGCRFDIELAEHAAGFFPRFLRHSKGEFAGKPFDLLPWQRDEVIMPLFGWVRPDGSRRFRKAYVEIPKKNGKSTLASGLGLYLLAGDGEAGAEVYSAATDKEQASIVHREAINMVDASPELSEVLRINRTTSTIWSDQTKSYYRAISSAPSGKEGYNAHAIICDELHVWSGREMFDALRYAFRARRQGLLFIITTAGDDMESVCRQEHDYAQQVIRGDITDNRYFAYIRAADPEDDLHDRDVWNKANPSMGIAINEEEFGNDLAEAEESPPSWSSFKRYSFNLWATSTNPWLNIHHWKDCRGDYTLDDLEGCECYAGLDLAKIRDLSAFSLCFPDDDIKGRFWFWVWFWMPEAILHDKDAHPSLKRWAEQGHITTTPGDVCDYAFIKRDIGRLTEQFHIVDMRFDPYNAEHLTQEIEEEFGLQRVSFAQTVTNYAEPTAEFERLVVSGEALHPNHPVLNWQAGHVTVRIDPSGNKRPIKPKHGDKRTIDGIVAEVMSLAGALDGEESAYQDRGILVV